MKKQSFVYPPDFQKAEKHRLATRIFKGIEEDDSTLQCQCCGHRIGVQNPPNRCCFKKEQLAFLGPGLPLFFSFIENSIIALLSLALFFCIATIIMNILGDSCTSLQNCIPNIYNSLSLVNKINNGDYLIVQNYLLLLFTVLFFFVIQFVRYRTRKINIYCDQTVNSPSDYSVLISRLPKDTTEQQILQMINQFKSFLPQSDLKLTDNLKVVKIIRGYVLDEYLKKLQENKNAFKTSITQDHQFYPQELPQLTQYSSIAVVVFSKKQSKDIFNYKAKFYQKVISFICDSCIPLSDFRIRGQRIAIERAPQPDDILWQNSNQSIKGAICLKIIYSIISFILLWLGGAAQYGLAILQNKFTNVSTIYYIGIGSSLMVTVMNQIIYRFLVYTASKEKKLTQTYVNISLIIKIGFFLFLNAGVFMIAAKVLAKIHTFKIQETLSSQITQIMILNIITPHISLIFFDYFQLLGKVKRWAIRKNYIFASQLDANINYEHPQSDIPFKYGYLIRTLWLTAFYCTITPIVVPISILGLIINYLLEKCLHMKSYRVVNMVSKRQNDIAVQLMEVIPFIMSMSQLIIFLYFYKFHAEQMPNYVGIPIYVSIGLSCLNFILPMQLINKRLFPLERQQREDDTYQKVQKNFEVTYEMVNPGYKSSRKRIRDKLLLQTIFQKLEQMKELNQTEPMKQLLIKNNSGIKETENPLQILLSSPNMFQAFNSNQYY